MSSEYSCIEHAIHHLSTGGIVIALDRERENEGDFLAIAETISADAIHFMVTQGRGHLCMPIHPSIATRLGLDLLVPDNELSAPPFAMPVDHRDCGTGISPCDRALTIQRLADPASTADEFSRPGHIFPLIAQTGGVVVRPGHTEASVDLALLCGSAPAAVLCEICSVDGQNMADRNELEELASSFDLPMVSIDELIRYRHENPELYETLAFSHEVNQSAQSDCSASKLGTEKQAIEGHNAGIVGSGKESPERSA